jgi:hypothetical protein
MFFNTSHSQTNGNEMVVIKRETDSQITVNPHLEFLLVPEDMNTEMRKILNGGDLTMILSTLDHCN